MKAASPPRVRLGEFEFDPATGELRRGSETVWLTEQPFRVLLILVEHSGGLVSREEIKKNLWPNDTVVDFEHGINAAMRILRRALGDSADEPRYIETIARRGYRLMVPVEELSVVSGQLSEPGLTAAAGMELQPTALTGRTVSHYRVLDIIGGGGMGVVYRAEDLKLGRAVALKFLSEELGSDAQALERFSREARAVSALDHPNICPIHEFGEHEGRPFMVMQLLEGQTLRDRLAAGEGALPLEELLEIALQVSDGLQAAHEKGIIHRDIKPANVFLTNKGVCKILDFGLAKLLVGNEEDQPAGDIPSADPAVIPSAERSEASRDPYSGENLAGIGVPRLAAQTPGRSLGMTQRDGAPAEAAPLHRATPVDPTLTRTGAAMGTAGYMSPEQVRGEKLDARTDIFSFGLVLYEMATGQRAFTGETAEIVRDTILYQPQTPVHDLNSKLPPELETIINKALEKDREQRYQSAAEMRDDLKGLHRGDESAIQEPRRHARVLLFWGVVLAIALLALGLGRRWFKGQQIAPAKTLSERLLTHNPSENRLIGAAISPDGKYLAYTDTKGLHLSVIGTGEIHDIPLPEELRTHLQDATWVPDGEKLLFTADSDAEPHMIWVASVFGGAPRKLRGDGDGPEASPQGSLIAFVSGNEHEIWVMGANGENPHRILTGENERYAALAWSPTGQRLAYIRAQSWAGGTIETLSLDGGAPSVVISDPQLENSGVPGLVWARDGRIIFVSHEVPWENGANLWEVMTDPWTGKASRRATKITNWDGVAPYSPTVSSDAKRLAVVKPHARYDVYVAELRDGGTRLAPPKRLTVSESEDYPSGWMRDSKTILFSSNRSGRKQIFRQRMEQDTAEPLIRGPDDEGDATLSPDGRWILYWSNPPGRDSPATTKRLMRFPALGGSPERVLEARKDDPDYFDCPVRPASSCVFAHWEQGQLIFYALDPVQGRGKELARTTLGAFTDLHYTVSPEGSRMAVASWDQLREQVRIVDFRTGMERNLPLPHGWRIYDLSWTADGNALFAAAGYFIARIELDGTTRVLLNRSRNHWLKYPCPSPDGRYLAFSQATFESNAWLLENF